MKTVYKLAKTIKNGTNVYGITAITQLDDVFTSKKEAVAFIEKCNRLGLSVIHFLDAVEDCLCSK